jgi:integrase
VLYGHTLDRFRDHLGHEPTLDDIHDLVVAGFLRWRAITPHKRPKVSAASVAKDKSQLTALANWAAKKRLKRSNGEPVEFLSLPRTKKIRHAPQAYTAAEVAALIRRARLRPGIVGGQPAGWWWSTLIYAAWQTAERIGALLALKWADVGPRGADSPVSGRKPVRDAPATFSEASRLTWPNCCGRKSETTESSSGTGIGNTRRCGRP